MKKYRLNEAIKAYDSFLNEQEVEANVEVTVEAPEVEVSGRDAMIADVDTIITSLETLAGQVQEMVDSLDTETVNELDAATALLHWAVTGPKAMKAQAKVNQMKINLQDLQFARDNADSKNKESLKAKAEAVKAKVDDAQKTVADKFDAKGDIVKGMRLKKKLEGERELIKRLTGMEDNPKKKAELKDQLANIIAREKEQTASIKELKPDEANDKEAVKKAQEEAAAKKKAEEEAADKAAADKAAADKAAADKAAADKTEDSKDDNAEETNADKIAKVEDDIKTYGKNIDDAEESIRNNETKVKKLESEKEKATDPEKIQADIDAVKKRIQDDKEDVKDMRTSRNNLKKELAKLSPKEQLAVRADLIGLNEMAIEIMGKEDWQFENNSTLYNKYNSIITKAEAAQVLNESRYFNNSIKDAFGKLI